jgi:hypothetical protein
MGGVADADGGGRKEGAFKGGGRDGGDEEEEKKWTLPRTEEPRMQSGRRNWTGR